jgi:hypothetical protein
MCSSRAPDSPPSAFGSEISQEIALRGAGDLRFDQKKKCARQAF